MEWWILLCVILLLMLALTWKIKGKTTTNFQKCIFISGCDSGIGFHLAVHLDALGCLVYAGCLYPDGEGAKLLEESSNRVKVVPLDVTNDNSVYSAANFVKEDLNGKDLWAIVNNAGVCVLGEFDWLTMKHCIGQLNVNLYGTINVTKEFLPLIRQNKDLWAIVNNAGVCVYGEFDWLTPQQCRSQLDVNLYGTIRLTKAFLSLIRQSKGRIINVSSVNGGVAYPGLSVYSATKYGLEGFSDVLRLELAKYGVRVIIIRPGDFARLTNIMSRHEKHQQEMWNCMSEEDKVFYDGYFQTFHNIARKNYGLTSAKSFESTSLFKDMKDALFSPDPSPRYVVAPLAFRIFFCLVGILPTSWTDSLMLYITKRVFDSLKE